jgi:hypothetical protein
VSPFGPSFHPQPRVYSQPFDFVGPLFSYSYGLFVVPKNIKSFAIRQIRTLAQNTGGGGCVSRLCALRASPTRRRVSMANPMFSAVCSLFVVSLRSFLHSLPLFSRACSLFRQNTRVGGGVSMISQPPIRSVRSVSLPAPTRSGSLRGNPICRLSGLQYTLRPGSLQHRRIYTPPWINA